jgi:undecaprenyl-diphosphatase
MSGKRRRSSAPTAAAGASAPEKADVAVTEAVAPYADSLPVRLLSTFSKLGDQPPMLALSGAVLGAGLLRGDARMARAGGRMIAAHLLATAAKNMIKRRIDRTRPGVLVEEGRYRMKPGKNRAKAVTSFPSGHSAGAIAVAAAFAQEYPEHRAAAYAAAGAIAIAQIPRCAHYPTDVAAGTAIGLLSALAAGSAIDRAGQAVPGSDEQGSPEDELRGWAAAVREGGIPPGPPHDG